MHAPIEPNRSPDKSDPIRSDRQSDPTACGSFASVVTGSATGVSFYTAGRVRVVVTSVGDEKWHLSLHGVTQNADTGQMTLASL